MAEAEQQLSRVGRAPVSIPKGAEVTIKGRHITVKGNLGTLEHDVHPAINIKQEEDTIVVSPSGEVDGNVRALGGLTRQLVTNMVVGVTEGFKKELELRGVGYRASVSGKILNLTLGFSHPVNYSIPEGITIETPSQTEIVVKGADKQAVGQVSADIRAYRPPEPYKGKGIRYKGEHIVMKEGKKA